MHFVKFCHSSFCCLKTSKKTHKKTVFYRNSRCQKKPTSRVSQQVSKPTRPLRPACRAVCCFQVRDTKCGQSLGRFDGQKKWCQHHWCTHWLKAAPIIWWGDGWWKKIGDGFCCLRGCCFCLACMYGCISLLEVEQGKGVADSCFTDVDR